MKIVLSCMALALMLLSTGCGGLKPGDEQMGELTRDSRLSEFMTDAESVMFEAGRPVSDDWACASASLRSGGSVAVEVESEEFDPILIAIDKEGSLLRAVEGTECEIGGHDNAHHDPPVALHEFAGIDEKLGRSRQFPPHGREHLLKNGDNLQEQ